MGPIDHAINSIRHKIPNEILLEVFGKQSAYWSSTPISIKEQITAQIIHSRVVPDLNIVGGTEALIPLTNVPYEQPDFHITVYRIPKHLTGGRTITSVRSVSFVAYDAASMMGLMSIFEPCSINESLVAGKAMMDAMASIPIPSTANVQLIGENVVMVYDTPITIGFGLLRCILAHDANLSHIQYRTYGKFSGLCVLATKAYIYNRSIIEIDEAKIKGGYQLGAYKNIIEGYADADAMYEEELIKWKKISMMNDRESYERYIRMQTGGYR